MPSVSTILHACSRVFWPGPRRYEGVAKLNLIWLSIRTCFHVRSYILTQNRSLKLNYNQPRTTKLSYYPREERISLSWFRTFYSCVLHKAGTPVCQSFMRVAPTQVDLSAWTFRTGHGPGIFYPLPNIFTYATHCALEAPYTKKLSFNIHLHPFFSYGTLWVGK